MSLRLPQFLLFFLLLAATLTSAQGRHVLFGERSPGTALSVCFDKEGTIYPDHFISNSSLDSAGASLLTWYRQHPLEFIAIAGKYNCNFSAWSDANAKTLVDSVHAATARKFKQSYPDNRPLTFLVHGFRKPIVFPDITTSTQDFNTMKRNIDSLSGSRKDYVEVYWDGLYGCCAGWNNKWLLRMFVEARGNAEEVGKGMRRLLSFVEKDSVNFITHSLGARVVSQTLFDLEPSELPTPQQKWFSAALVAPALGPEDFDNYYVRRPVDSLALDPYRLMIVYNEEDLVLRKRFRKIFGPGAYRFGNTSLGCNFRGEIKELQKTFEDRFPISQLEVLDMTERVGENHLVSGYFRRDNLSPMVRFLFP